MKDYIITHGLQYGIYLLEVVLFVLLAQRGKLRRLKWLGLYVFGFFVVDGVARPVVLHYFGFVIPQYSYFYWLTDVVLVLGAFLLICSFFRRACAREEKMWGFTRSLLVFAFVLVLAISALFLTRNYTQLFTASLLNSAKTSTLLAWC